MEYPIDIFSKIFGSLGGVGFLVGIIILWKTGLLQYLLEIKKNGGKNDTAKKICDLEEHARVANYEMGQVRERLTSIETKLEILMKHLKI